MAATDLTHEWNEYKAAFQAFTAASSIEEGGDVPDGPVDAVDFALGELATWSQRLAAAGSVLLHAMADEDLTAAAADRERLETFLLATAAVDIAIAREALQLGPDRLSPDSEISVASDGLEVVSAEALIEEVDGTLGAEPILIGGGSELGRAELVEVCEEAFTRLVDAAYDPARGFAVGVASAGYAHLPAALRIDVLIQLEQLKRLVGRIKRQVVRLVTAAFTKLFAVSAATSRELTTHAVALMSNSALVDVRAATKQVLNDLLGSCAGRTAAGQATTAAILRAQEPLQDTYSDISSDLHRLTQAYKDQMKWADTIGTLISHAAPFISTLGAPLGGPLLVVALESVGLGFVVGSLRLRITGSVLGRQGDGVVTIVNHRI